MTRTDVMASSRPRTAGVASMRRGSSGILCRLSIVPAVLVLALALAVPSAAVAATEPTTTGYSQTPTTPSTGTSPSKEESKPTTTSKEAAPATSSAPATQAKASTLPFTGFDLRWSLGIGVLMMGAGLSIVAVQRRQRRQSGR